MIRLFGFLSMATIMAGGFLFIDYRMSVQAAVRDGGESPTIRDYVTGLPDRVAELASASAGSGRAASLAAMLPQAPEGWTMRPVTKADIEQFLPESDRKADKTAVAMIKDMARATAEDGSEVAAFAYEKGGRTLLIRAIRYPDAIFTDASALDQRVELQAMGPELRGTEFMTVRGLDVSEDLLPKDFRGRYFLADVGAQIHLRVLAPRRMKDAELLTFFETLHVPAMNASVVDKVEGLGEAPVIVVASALDDAGRDAYVAAVAARKAEETLRHDAARQAAEAELAAEKAAQGTAVDQGSLFDAVFGSLLGEETPQVSSDDLTDHQAALVEAAQSGDAATMKARAEAIYGDIANDLGKTDGKTSLGSGSAGGSSRSNSTIELGGGNCVTQEGRKICSVGGSN